MTSDLFGSFSDPDELGFGDSLPADDDDNLDDLLDFEAADEFFDMSDFPPPSSSEAATEVSIPAIEPMPEPVAMSPSAEETVVNPQPVRAQTTTSSARRTTSSRPRRRSSNRGALGLTPQQRMILAILFFVDVVVVGFLLLAASGAIGI